MNWGRAIFLSFLLFGGIIISLVVISMNQDISLVAKNYYEQEIRYQERIHQMENAQSLPILPKIEVEGERLTLRFDSTFSKQFEMGSLTLFSPLTPEEDKKYTLEKAIFPDYEINVATLRKGNWKVKVEWKDVEKSYYIEKLITL